MSLQPSLFTLLLTKPSVLVCISPYFSPRSYYHIEMHTILICIHRDFSHSFTKLGSFYLQYFESYPLLITMKEIISNLQILGYSSNLCVLFQRIDVAHLFFRHFSTNGLLLCCLRKEKIFYSLHIFTSLFSRFYFFENLWGILILLDLTLSSSSLFLPFCFLFSVLRHFLDVFQILSSCSSTTQYFVGYFHVANF